MPPSNPPTPVFFFFFLPLLTLSNPDDSRCLSNLLHSLSTPLNWSQSTLSNPCPTTPPSSTTPLGITCNNGRIFKLSLPNLSLHGSISPYLSNCTNLQSLDLSSNSFTSSIPSDLHLLLNLAVLNLSHNSLSGPIPSHLSLSTYLNVIDLSHNRLSGSIPPQLGLLARLSSFDVSYNRLSGPIPASLGNRTGNGAARFNATAFEGNRDLYGYPLGGMKSKEALSVTAIVGIGLGSGLVSLVLSFTAVCVWLRIGDRRSRNDDGKINQLMPEY